jgi:uncharacterized damage-inducible protein DinB
MTDELRRLEDQVRRAFEGSAWHGPSVMESIEGLDAASAHAHPIASAHSAWELVLHLGGTYRLVLRRVAGENAQLAREDDWPAVPEPTAGAWAESIGTLKGLNSRVRAAILRFDVAQLDRPLPAGCPYDAYTQFIGITQHDLYHAGQIALLRKAL